MRLFVFILAAFAVARAEAETLTVAVASNFSWPAQELVARFTEVSGVEARVAAASTGKLYAQVVNGAPFDVLLAADAHRPALLEESGAGMPGTRFTYAIGRLVLWSADPALADANCRDQLDNLETMRLAIANPLTAPYGVAAMQFLTRADVWDEAQDNLVYGENIAQTLQFVASGNASLGVIAASQVLHESLPAASCDWVVPATMHEPIEQQAIQLSNNEAARAFLEFVRGPQGRRIIRGLGYEVPD